MFRDVIAPTTTAQQWAEMRVGLRDRIHATMGTFPAVPAGNPVEYLEEQRVDGVRIRNLRWAALPGITTHGVLIQPADGVEGGAGVLCLHGTDLELAHRNTLSPSQRPNRAYALELARRGATTMAVDQFGFGAGNSGRSQEETIAAFAARYPAWSLDGIRLYIHQRALDLLGASAGVAPDRLGCIGHSLGGRAAVYLAAFDERIRACVASTGVSPNLTNVFRNRPGDGNLSPALADEIARSGRPPFEYQELLALIAPRGLFLIEPWNDAYNPLIEPVLRCFEKARFVYELGGASDRLQLLVHGDGHDTTDEVRDAAYAWLTRQLAP